MAVQSWRPALQACALRRSWRRGKAVTASAKLGIVISGSVRHEYRASSADSSELELKFVTALGKPSAIFIRPCRKRRAAACWRDVCRPTLRREVGDVLLRGIDDREPLVEHLQVFGGLLARRLHRGAEMLADRVEALVDRALQFRVLGVEHVAHGGNAAGGLVVQAGELKHVVVAPRRRA